MSGPKHHHQVPRFLLRRFAIDDHVQMRTRSGIAKSIGTRSAAAKEHFYSFFDEQGAHDVELENYLSEAVAHPAALAIARLVDGLPRAGDEEDLARFVAWQVARSPHLRRIGDLLLDVLPPIVAGFDAVSASQAGESDETWSDRGARRLLDAARASPPPEYEVSHDVNRDIRMVIWQATRFLGALDGVAWCVAEADHDAFVMGDSPAELFKPLVLPGGFGGFGFNAASEIRLPLGPRHVLLGSTVRLGGPQLAASPDLVRSVNEGQANGCLYAVFAREGTECLRRHADRTPTKMEFPTLSDPRLRTLIERTGAPGLVLKPPASPL